MRSERKQAITEEQSPSKSLRAQIEKNSSFEYPKNIRFVCNSCALCCGDTDSRQRMILLLRNEAAKISKITSKEISDFAENVRGLQPYSFSMHKNEEGKCVFLTGKSCSIYQNRPLVCQFYPFELLTNHDGKYLFNCTSECPNVGKGSVIGKGFFEDLFQRSRDLFSTIPTKVRLPDLKDKKQKMR
jgi:Fe-S-cluster containining protein